ncbi:hypothetical protein SAMN04487769_0246 [Burkholderia sp. b14]|nr:hypothetical protein SAMN04487769_0246 [Burkholderia sp. b14]
MYRNEIRQPLCRAQRCALQPDFRTGWNTSFFHRKAYQPSFSTASLRDATGKWVASFCLMRFLWVLLVQGRESLSPPGRDTDAACPWAVARSCGAISKSQYCPLSLFWSRTVTSDTPLSLTSSISRAIMCPLVASFNLLFHSFKTCRLSKGNGFERIMVGALQSFNQALSVAIT